MAIAALALGAAACGAESPEAEEPEPVSAEGEQGATFAGPEHDQHDPAMGAVGDEPYAPATEP